MKAQLTAAWRELSDPKKAPNSPIAVAETQETTTKAKSKLLDLLGKAKSAVPETKGSKEEGQVTGMETSETVRRGGICCHKSRIAI